MTEQNQPEIQPTSEPQQVYDVKITVDDIKTLMTNLAEMYSRQEQLNQTFNDMRAAIIPAEIQNELENLATEWQPIFDNYTISIRTLENTIREEVLKINKKVETDDLQAILVKARVSWDTRILDALALLYPVINEAKVTGNPTVTLKRRK